MLKPNPLEDLASKASEREARSAELSDLAWMRPQPRLQRRCHPVRLHLDYSALQP